MTGKKIKSSQLPSELRHDPVSHGWVVIATGRARRPEEFQRGGRRRVSPRKITCPFENLKISERPTAVFFQGKRVKWQDVKGRAPSWSTIVLPNKYPAFSPSQEGVRNRRIGPYHATNGVGFHEVIVTRSHTQDIPHFQLWQVRELVEVYQNRYLAFMREKFVNYISIFKNKGSEAGASLSHPHSQLIAIPVTDPDVERSLAGSFAFWRKHKKCAHCAMLQWDLREKKRIVEENECFVALCPFASKVSFEIRIYPKAHTAYFERSNDYEKDCFSRVLFKSMRKLSSALRDPDYNYFIHTAPADGRNYDHYHWHLEILPKTATWAGFELGTGIEISTIEPEKAAAFLRKQ